MSDAPPAAVAAVTPAPGSVVSTPGTLAGPSASPVNAISSASKANQQAVAAGENKGLTNQDGTPATPPDTPPATPPVTEAGTASLDAGKTFVPSGNKQIDQVTSLLSNANFDGADGIINEVISTQELSLTSKAKLVDELGNDVAQLVINQLETSVAAVKEAGELEGKRLKDYAFGKFGGANAEETWTGLQQFAKSESVNLSADDRKSMNEMLSAGGIKAELVIDSLFTKYKASGQYIERPTLMQGDGTNQSSNALMSKKEYQEKIGPAVNKFGESSQEVQALRQRRQFSLMKGYN